MASLSQGPSRGGGGAALKPAGVPRWEGGQLGPGATAPLRQPWRQGPGRWRAGRAHRVTTQTSRSEAEDLGPTACGRLPSDHPPDPGTPEQREGGAQVTPRKTEGGVGDPGRVTSRPGLSGTVPVLVLKVPGPRNPPVLGKWGQLVSLVQNYLDTPGWCTAAPRAGIHCGRGQSGWALGGRTQPRAVSMWG